MTDAVKEEFIKLVGVMPSGKNKTATEIAKLQSNYEAKLEGFRLARGNGVPAGEADRRDAELYRWLRDVSDELWPFALRMGFHITEIDQAVCKAISIRNSQRAAAIAQQMETDHG